MSPKGHIYSECNIIVSVIVLYSCLLMRQSLLIQACIYYSIQIYGYLAYFSQFVIYVFIKFVYTSVYKFSR